MGFVTVVRCDLSADYRHCRVHVSVLADNEGEISRVMHMLQDARGFIQRHVAANLSTRATPHGHRTGGQLVAYPAANQQIRADVRRRPTRVAPVRGRVDEPLASHNVRC